MNTYTGDTFGLRHRHVVSESKGRGARNDEGWEEGVKRGLRRLSKVLYLLKQGVYGRPGVCSSGGPPVLEGKLKFPKEWGLVPTPVSDRGGWVDPSPRGPSQV